MQCDIIKMHLVLIWLDKLGKKEKSKTETICFISHFFSFPVALLRSPGLLLTSGIIFPRDACIPVLLNGCAWLVKEQGVPRGHQHFRCHLLQHEMSQNCCETCCSGHCKNTFLQWQNVCYKPMGCNGGCRL